MLHLEAEWPSKKKILIADRILAEPGPYPDLNGQWFIVSYDSANKQEYYKKTLH